MTDRHNRLRALSAAAKLGSVLALVMLCAAVSVSALGSPVKYTRHKLFELATLADVIVTGEIVEVTKTTFELQVDTSITADSMPERITVKRFVDWTCAGRWTAYAKGQRVLLFLGKPSWPSSTYSILGGGGEGEMPLDGADVIVRGFQVHGGVNGEHALGSLEIGGSLVPLIELAAAVRLLRPRVAWTFDDKHEYPVSVEASSGVEDLRRYSRMSKFAQQMVEELLSSPRYAGERLGSQASPLALDRAVAVADPADPRTAALPRAGIGSACAYVGDVDGNGTGDWIVGASRDSRHGKGDGVAWLLMMNADAQSPIAVEISQKTSGFASTTNEYANLGAALAGLGDLDGDGVPDVAISAPSWNGVAKDQGGVWILFLNANGTVRESVELVGTPGLRAASFPDVEHLGQSLANLGDLDGDGLPELAIGQDSTLDWPDDRRKRIWVVSLGRTGRPLKVSTLFEGLDGLTGRFSSIGEALAAPGDVDRDGVPDLVLADVFDDDGGECRGAVWVAFLNSDATIKNLQKISDWEGGFDGLLGDSAFFGNSLCAPGDLDGDGTPDLLVGASEHVWALFLNRDGTVKGHWQTCDRGGRISENDSLHGSLATSGTRDENGRLMLFASGWRLRTQSVFLLDLHTDGSIASW